MILIDRPMPKSCASCPCLDYIIGEGLEEDVRCVMTDNTWNSYGDVPDDERAPFCPMKEVPDGSFPITKAELERMGADSMKLQILQSIIEQYSGGLNDMINGLLKSRDILHKQDPRTYTAEDTMSLFQLNTMLEVVQPILKVMKTWCAKAPGEDDEIKHTEDR